jgi:hypothetical protein
MTNDMKAGVTVSRFDQADVNHPTAIRFEAVDEGGLRLQVWDADGVIAVYAPGSWSLAIRWYGRSEA